MYYFMNYQVKGVMTRGPITVGPDVTLADVEDIFEEHDKQGIGFFVEILPQERWVIEVSYRLADKFIFAQDFVSYAFYWQKQPGIKESDFTFQVNYPESFTPVEIAPGAKTSSGQVFFETTTLKDRPFLISFNKK